MKQFRVVVDRIGELGMAIEAGPLIEQALWTQQQVLLKHRAQGFQVWKNDDGSYGAIRVGVQEDIQLHVYVYAFERTVQ